MHRHFEARRSPYTTSVTCATTISASTPWTVSITVVVVWDTSVRVHSQSSVHYVNNALANQHVSIHDRGCLFISSADYSHCALPTGGGQIKGSQTDAMCV